ncbi:hypothetical protein C2E23DRAFT_806960 [Lenzites betulinus]|nr:hypothetical protein C2E23DRAFT_806960 [Lenzites betulinus]
MTGPPTPPPSSAVEIEDAARTVLPPPAQAAPTPAPAPATEPVTAPPAEAPVEEAPPGPTIVPKQPTTYDLLFPSIKELAKNGSLRELIEVAESGDLTGEYHADPSRMLLVGPLVLAYLISDELSAARHVLTRLPDSLAAYPLSQGLFQLLASTHERKYQDVYRRAEDLHQYVSQPAFSEAELGQIMAGMATSFIGSFRKKTFELLSKAYTSIPLPLAQWYLGYPAEQSDEFLNVTLANGWKFNQDTRILTPSKSASSSRGPAYAQSTLQAFNLVADTVANLEA